MASASPAAAEGIDAALWARRWHAATCVVGAFGVVSQLWIVATQTVTPQLSPFSLPIRLWNVLSYFTIWSNIIVTGVAFLLARNPRRRRPVFSVVHLASLIMIAVTGVVYAVVLAPIWDPTGWQRVADQALHYATPLIAVAGYLLFGPRPSFSLRTLGLTLVIPLSWLAYTLIRSPFISYAQGGETRHWYPYHFINVDDLGHGRSLLNAAGFFLFFLAIGGLFCFLDRRLAPAPPG